MNESKFTKVYLGLGCNLGDRMESLEKALQEIEQLGQELKSARIYESKAWGYDDPNLYLNTACAICTGLPVEVLHQETLRIERKLGREARKRRAGEPFRPRMMDIDILFYGDEVIRSGDLEVPHPRLHLRNFVLRPLLDLNPELVHPCFNKSISELILDLEEETDIVVIR